MSVAKGLGGGFPVGACLAREDAAAALCAGSHGSTFGGNPLAMAAANAVLDVINTPEFLKNVNDVAKKFWAQLIDLAAAYPRVIEEIRGSGLMIGVKCKVNSSDLRSKLLASRMLCVGAADNVIRILPPLIIESSHVDEAMKILHKACAMIDRVS